MNFLNRAVLPAHAPAPNSLADGATVTIDWSLSDKHTVTLTASRTIAFSNDLNGQSILIRFISGGTGAFTPVWPSGIKWQGGVAPALSNASGHHDFVSITRWGSGDYSGSYSNNYS